MEASAQDPYAPTIQAVGTALPPHYVEQATLTAALGELWKHSPANAARFQRIQQSLGIRGRYLPMQLDEYRALDSFAKCNDAWLRHAPDLAEQAVRAALERAALDPSEIDHIFFVTVTGIATPSLEVQLVNRLRMRRDIRRTPIFGLGCAAGAGVIGRAADYLRAYPQKIAMVVSAELCSLTLQRGDTSAANMIASGLFGDGAAAAIMYGAARAGDHGPQVIDSQSIICPDTERMLGWDLVESGFKIVLSARLPEVVRNHLAADVDAFIGAHGLALADITHWIVHAGGPKVIDAVEEALALPPAMLGASWRSLQRIGNVSSASVLFILDELLASGRPQSGEWGMMLAMGPGFGIELVLLRW
jgi:alkylresorcinol/alkylpyrone synthase